MRLLGSLHFAVVVLLVTIGVGMYADLKSEQLHQHNVLVRMGLERMVRYNQQLTSSVAMAALDKNALRAASYPSLNLELQATLAEVGSLTQDMALASDMVALSQEQRDLRDTEQEAFVLMSQGAWDEAYRLVLGNDYGMALKLYEINSEAAVGALTIELTRTAQQHDRLRALTLVLRLGAAGLLLWVGWRYSQRLQADLAEQTRLRSAVSAANAALEEKVKLRTHELEQVNGLLATLSTTDGLTGLANRRRFDDCWRDEWLRALRNATPLAVVMLDVDHFKAYNDHFGHLEGDECLSRVAEVLKATIRRSGELVARYGGEEFVAVMPGASVAQALEAAQAMRAAVEHLKLAHPTSPGLAVVTVSVGVAVGVPKATETRDTLVQAADQALYEAKRSGRNRVVAAAQASA